MGSVGMESPAWAQCSATVVVRRVGAAAETPRLIAACRVNLSLDRALHNILLHRITRFLVPLLHLLSHRLCLLSISSTFIPLLLTLKSSPVVTTLHINSSSVLSSSALLTRNNRSTSVLASSIIKSVSSLPNLTGTQLSTCSVSSLKETSRLFASSVVNPSSKASVEITTITASPSLSDFVLPSTRMLSHASSTSDSCFTKPIPTAKCIPCECQGGSLPYCGADVRTNNYNFTPKTCRNVYYTLDITNTMIVPDGIPRMALLVNGQMPGAVIEASWGDTVIITVNNKMQNNGTSMHFHGIRQLNTSEYDGTPSITQCPIAPRESIIYEWVATNHGTSWVFGPLIVHGSTSKGYDVDAGTIMLQDWSHNTVDSMHSAAEDVIAGGPRIMDDGLINGKNTWGFEGTNNQTGKRFELNTKFEPGKSYLFGIINAAIQSTYKFYIDGHALEVISIDFTPIQLYTSKVLNINIGQRYMVLVKADQPVGDYWMRSDNQNACAGTVQTEDIKGIVRYYSYATECADEPMAPLVPMAEMSATDKDLEFEYGITVAGNSKNLFKWYLSGTTFEARDEEPTLVGLLYNGTAPTYSGNLILDLLDMKEWLPHPIHLHGHDFFILAEEPGTYNASTPLKLKNPPRRDTALMPASGFLVVAFEADNPGVWLMHCYIG
ncbi:multicopper oxidase [Zopfia rhizophila CBS 207.26]|uniref:Multicopper oxidase n=1 Tax=Zopfia rhizophila CBS 207.26 TaxID=1314779 RepID=A0A6A6ERW5_9PEZI|nr:multicopper oxidase [Zopfia rhizophila CBS 207.26]